MTKKNIPGICLGCGNRIEKDQDGLIPLPDCEARGRWGQIYSCNPIFPVSMSEVRRIEIQIKDKAL